MPKLDEQTAYYDQVYQEHSDSGWDRAPGKEVLLAAIRHLHGDGSIDAGARVVDIGCGTGFLLDRIRLEVSPTFLCYGVDFSPKAIRRGQELHPELQLRCEDGAATTLEPHSFSLAISYGSLEHFPSPAKGILELARLLGPDGLFLTMQPTLGVFRTDRSDEGWYEDLTGQKQWNWRRETWAKAFGDAGLVLWPEAIAARFGALKPGVFFFGRKGSAAPR